MNVNIKLNWSVVAAKDIVKAFVAVEYDFVCCVVFK